MATSNNAIRVADLDFTSIRTNLKEYLRSQSQFNDYDFEGSGMSVLLDLLAYNTYYNSFYLNMVANEAFLDTAQIRQNILSHAKLINYIPRSATGAEAKINLLITPSPSEDANTNYIVLDRYTRIMGADIDGINYPFVCINSNSSYKVANTFSFSNVVVKQGEVITQQFTAAANNVQRRYQLASQNVDTETIVVNIQESASNTYTRQFNLADDLTEIRANTEVFFLEEDDTLKYTIYFGDDVIGRKPANGNIITVTYVDTKGSSANNISKFMFQDPIAGLYSDNVRITVTQSSHSGTDKEEIDQIRFRAPYHYTAQNRAVTLNDYESLITRDFNNIEAVTVWGGEDNDPPVYGKVYMSLKTRGYYTLTNLEKENIKDNLIKNRNVLTVVPEIVDPNYVFVMVQGSVTYNPTLTDKSQGELLNTVRQAVYDYANQELYTFRSTFRQSKLQYYIENCDPSIRGSDINIYIQIRQKMGISKSQKYVLQFNTPLRKGDYFRKLYSYPQVNVKDSQGIEREIFFEEIPESFTGIGTIEITNAGYNYESAPTVIITGDGTGAKATAFIARGRLQKIEVTNPGVNYTRAFVQLLDGEGREAAAIAVLQSSVSTLRSFYYKENGEKVYVNEDAGRVNYTSGRVELYTLKAESMPNNPFYDQDVLTVNVVPDGQVIPPLRNRIFAIDTNNAQSISLELVPEA